MSHGHPCRPRLKPHRIQRHQLLLIGIYRSSKNSQKCRLRRLWVEFEWHGVLPAPPIGGHLFRQIAKWCFCMMSWPASAHLVRSFGHHKVSTLYVLRTVWLRITTFYADIRTDQLYIHTGCDVIATSSQKLLRKKRWKCCLRRVLVKFLKDSLSKDHTISHTYWGQSAWQTCQIWRH